MSRSLIKPPLGQRTGRPEPDGIQLSEIQDGGSVSNKRRHRGAKALLPDNHSLAQAEAEDTKVVPYFPLGKREAAKREPKDERHD